MDERPGRMPFGHEAVLASTFFGVGFVKWAPGTVASLLTVPLAWGIQRVGGPGALFLIALLIFAIGVWSSGVYMRRTGRADAPEIVIDEVSGQMLALIFARPESWWQFAAGFALFRIFDILKPWPVSWADRHVPGGLGVMLDDLAAAIYASISLYAIVKISETGYFQRLLASAG